MTLDSFNALIAKLDGWLDGAVLTLNRGAAVLMLLGCWIAVRLLSTLTARLLRWTIPFPIEPWTSAVSADRLLSDSARLPGFRERNGHG